MASPTPSWGIHGCSPLLSSQECSTTRAGSLHQRRLIASQELNNVATDSCGVRLVEVPYHRTDLPAFKPARRGWPSTLRGGPSGNSEMNFDATASCSTHRKEAGDGDRLRLVRPLRISRNRTRHRTRRRRSAQGLLDSGREGASSPNRLMSRSDRRDDDGATEPGQELGQRLEEEPAPERSGRLAGLGQTRVNRAASPRAGWTSRSYRPAAASAISRALPRASDWLRSRYSSARVIAWRRSLRPRGVGERRGHGRGRDHPAQPDRHDRDAQALLVGQRLDRTPEPIGDLGPAGREQLVDAAIRQCPRERHSERARATTRPSARKRYAAGSRTRYCTSASAVTRLRSPVKKSSAAGSGGRDSGALAQPGRPRRSCGSGSP